MCPNGNVLAPLYPMDHEIVIVITYKWRVRMTTIKILRNLLLGASFITLAGAGITACGQSADTPRGDQTRTDTTASNISDSAMTAQVRVRISTATGLEDSDINVSTRDGVVTLDGEVIDMNARSTAEREAKSVDGVRSIQNNLEISGNDGAVNIDTSGLTHNGNQ